jgi:hypothetical protein
VSALLAYLAALAVNNRFYLYPTFFSFLLHTTSEDVLNMIDSPHTQLEPTTQNPHMPVYSLEEQALGAIFPPMVRKCIWVYVAFINWKVRYNQYRFSKKHHGPPVYFPKEYFWFFFLVTGPTELPPGNAGDMAD